MDPSSTPHLGQMLLHQRLMAGGQILECLELQEQRGRPGGRVVPLGKIALEKGYVSPEQLHEALQRQSLLARNRPQTLPATPTSARLREEYKILRPLGRDAHFSTFQAQHAASGALVALRVLDPATEGPEVARQEALCRSVDGLLRLQHPGLQPLVAGGRMGSDLFFAAEYLDGVSLHRLIRDCAPLDWRWCWDLAFQMATALEYAHGEKVFHGGIRPSNILIVRGGRAVLAHLGLVVSERENTLAMIQREGQVPVYMATEQLASDRPPQAHTDLFSLGASLLHAATGRAPCAAGSPEGLRNALHRRLAADLLSLHSELPASFVRILDRMTSPEPQDRYPSAWDLLNDLAELKPLVEQSADLQKFQDQRNELLDSHLEESTAALPATGAGTRSAKAAATSGGLGRFLGAAALPLFFILLLAPSLTFLYRHVYAHRVFLLQGEQLYFRRQMPEALAKFQKSQTLRPDKPELQERILSFALETRDYALADRQIELLLKLRPQEAKKLQLLKVDLLLWGGQPAAALRGYRDFLRQHGEDLETRLRIAQAQAAGRALSEALATYAEVHSAYPNEPRALLEMARLSAALGLHEQSTRLYANHLKRHGETPPILIEYARTLEACREFDAAAKAYERVLALKKDNGEVTFARGQALLWHGDSEGARRLLEGLKDRAAEHPEWVVVLARAHETARDFAKAETLWKDLIGLHPSRADFAMELGKLYERMGQIDPALEQLEATLKRFGPTAELLASLARLRAARKEPKEALALFLRAARMDPGNRSYPVDIARTLLWLERPQEALEALESTGAAEARSPEFELERARVLFRLGVKPDAKAILARLAREVKPDSPFLKPLSELELEGTSEPGKARLYETYLQKHPEDLDALRRFAQLLRASGDHARAWPLYRKRLELEPRNPALVLEASDEAAWAGDPATAIRLLETLRQSAVTIEAK